MLKSLAAEIFGIDVDPSQGGSSLADFEWRHRVVIIVSDENHALASRQANLLLADEEGLKERDIIVLEVGPNRVQTLFGPSYALNPYAIRYDLDISDPVFGLLLVGKDGSVKLRSNSVVMPFEIFALIDQMPMRQNEMRH